MKQTFLKIDEIDNVLVALEDLPAGTSIDSSVQLLQPVSQKHKFSINDLEAGDEIYMYGIPVGRTNQALKAGSIISTQNVTHYAKVASIHQRNLYHWNTPQIDRWQRRFFQGYRRNDGKVGTANYWLFIPLVFCENRNLRVIEKTFSSTLGYQRPNQYEIYVKEKLNHPLANKTIDMPRVFQNIDGIRFLYHEGGCGGTRQDSEALIKLLVGYLANPNVAGATVLSLGCQHAQIQWFKEIQEEIAPSLDKEVIFLEQQALRKEEVLIKRAIDETLEALAEANQVSRSPASLDELSIGLECGGSDGFSGISANPVLGNVSDILVALGGSTILGEFPELNGVEQNLIDRCKEESLARKFLKLQKDYEKLAIALGSGFDMNPSPGNISDGLITDAMKSAGAAKKGGKAPISDVLDYGEILKRKGLNLLCTPGNDVESTTAMVGSGANLILFSTGLGTPTGNPVAPVIKVSSNSSLFHRMNDIIDFDTGTIISGEHSIEELSHALLENIIAIASGEKTKSMSLEQHDFIPWKRGVSL